MGCCESERGLFSIAFAPWKQIAALLRLLHRQPGRSADLRVQARARQPAPRRRGQPPRPARHPPPRAPPTTTAASSNGARTTASTSRPATAPPAAARPRARRTACSGKILRINPLRRKGPARTPIPKDNPYVGSRGRGRDLRPRPAQPVALLASTGGKIAIGDVGEGSSEEVDYERLRAARGRQLRLEQLRGQLADQRAGARPPRPADPHVLALAAAAARSPAATSSRDPDLRSLQGPLRLRRPLHRPDPQPHGRSWRARNATAARGFGAAASSRSARTPAATSTSSPAGSVFRIVQN